MPTLRFTKRAIDALPHPEKGQVLYRDEMLRGFGLRAGAMSKVYFAEGQVQNRTRRVTIGRADVMGVDSARKRALGILSDMATGVDPNAEKRRVAQECVTLSQPLIGSLQHVPPSLTAPVRATRGRLTYT